MVLKFAVKNDLSVPDRRRFGHVKVICVTVLACVSRKRGKWGGSRGWVRGLKMGQVTLSMEP